MKWLPEPIVPTWPAPRDVRSLGDRGGVGIREAALRLRALEVLRGADPELSDQEARPLDENAVEPASVELELAVPSRARGDGARELVHERLDPVSELVRVERKREQSHAAVDVVADAAGGDHAVRELRRCHASDREAVPLVDVGHRERRVDDPRERRDVLELLQRPVAADRVEEHVVREHPRRNAHVRPGVRRDLPERRVHLPECQPAHSFLPSPCQDRTSTA